MATNPFAYWDAITAGRALLVDEDDALRGATLISAESALTQDADAISYIHENFPSFLHYLRYLSKLDQELLLTYYLVRPIQDVIAAFNGITQTICSTYLRLAIKRLCLYFMCDGEPTLEFIRTTLQRAGLEDSLPGCPLSTAIDRYRKTRSFAQVAREFKLWRPDVRRTMSKVSKALMERKDAAEVALGAYIFGLIDKANPVGRGLSKREAQKRVREITRKDPDILGKFRIRIGDPDYDFVFQPRADK